HTSTSLVSEVGSTDHSAGGRRANIANMGGAAAVAPVRPGLAAPLALPTHTPTVNREVLPIDHASRSPQLVPVFQAICLAFAKLRQFASSPGRPTSSNARSVSQADAGPISAARVVSVVSLSRTRGRR